MVKYDADRGSQHAGAVLYAGVARPVPRNDGQGARAHEDGWGLGVLKPTFELRKLENQMPARTVIKRSRHAAEAKKNIATAKTAAKKDVHAGVRRLPPIQAATEKENTPPKRKKVFSADVLENERFVHLNGHLTAMKPKIAQVLKDKHRSRMDEELLVKFQGVHDELEHLEAKARGRQHNEDPPQWNKEMVAEERHRQAVLLAKRKALLLAKAQVHKPDNCAQAALRYGGCLQCVYAVFDAIAQCWKADDDSDDGPATAAANAKKAPEHWAQVKRKVRSFKKLKSAQSQGRWLVGGGGQRTAPMASATAPPIDEVKNGKELIYKIAAARAEQSRIKSQMAAIRKQQEGQRKAVELTGTNLSGVRLTDNLTLSRLRAELNPLPDEPGGHPDSEAGSDADDPGALLGALEGGA
jgi:hypothetical protein